MRPSWLEFEPTLFAKVLAGTMAVALLGLLGAVWLFGSVTTTDTVGTLICILIVAYMVHLWLLPEHGVGGEGQ